MAVILTRDEALIFFISECERMAKKNSLRGGGGRSLHGSFDREISFRSAPFFIFNSLNEIKCSRFQKGGGPLLSKPKAPKSRNLSFSSEA